MKTRLTPIALAVALACSAGSLSAQAQQEAAKPADKKDEKDVVLPGVEVTGIRASLQQSIDQKRRSDSRVEVITAEDVGKMPDRNVADSLQRVPGVTISSASATEGGFDEKDRVSLRGTNPSLTLTTINGHMVGSGDWFVLNQVGTVGRSVSYSLLPSELVKSVVVRKSATADLLEGGVAGNVDIQTNKPLDFRKQLTLEASAGLEYSDLPRKTDPQFSGLVNWRSEARTIGVGLQLFSQKRHLRRDGVEMLGYGRIGATSPIAVSNPDLAGVAYPNGIGSALFEQTRKREGGLLDFQIKPTDDLMFDLSLFNSRMDATNYNRNFIVWPSRILDGGNGQAPDPGYVVRNGTLVSANFTNLGTPAARRAYGVVDQIYRPGANSDTKFLNLDGSLRVNDKLKLTGRVGTSKGKGETPKQEVFEGLIYNSGASYTLHGTGTGPDAALPGANTAVFTGTTLDWIFGASPARTTDKEDWAQLDAEYALEAGPVTGLKFGARAARHTRDTQWTAQGPKFPAPGDTNPANDPFQTPPAWNGQVYPGDFGSGLGGNFLRNVWQIDPGVLEAWGDKFSNRDPLTRQYFPGEFEMSEKTGAAYAMANFEGKGWSGNAGLRLVQTKVNVLVNVAVPQNPTGNPATPNDCAPLAPCSVAGAITTSAFGAFYRLPVKNTYNDVMPSANLKLDLAKDLVGRVALARTIARPDYSALGGAISLDDTNRTGSGGNPNLKPIRSTNLDLAAEWYFAPRSLASLSVFHMDLSNYVSFGTSKAVYFNERDQAFREYTISSPVNSKGRVSGFELGYEQPLWGNFGVVGNYTYADAKEKGGGELVGNSKNTYNLVGYFENDWLNARMAYNYRSSFFNGLDRSTAQHQDSTGTLAASLGWKISENLTLALDALNLNNPVLKYYANNIDQPTAMYVNGRQYYLTLRAKL